MKAYLLLELNNVELQKNDFSNFSSDQFGPLIPVLDEKDISVYGAENPIAEILRSYGYVELKQVGSYSKDDVALTISKIHEASYSYLSELKAKDEQLYDNVIDVEIEIDFDDEFEQLFAPDDIDPIPTDDDYSHNPWSNEEPFIPSWFIPGPDQFAWYLEDDRSQLRKAYNLLGKDVPSIKIGHLDTGVAKHEALPENLLVNEGYDFKEGKKDPSDPMNYSRNDTRLPGHGVGTMTILAGKDIRNSKEELLPIGGNPSASVVPIRVGNSPVNVLTRRMGKAFMHALDKNCEVISMSMGGVPSRLTAKAINKLYENGVVVVTAAGNNYKRKLVNNLITKSVVYPARFSRVIAVSGITGDYKPYWKKKNEHLPGKVMQGNWGPKKAMKTAVSAFTPNVPWAIGDPKVEGKLFRKSGGGTSAATPQVAAAASLYLAKYKEDIEKLIGREDWLKTEIVRQAIFQSCSDRSPDGVEISQKKNGHGYIQAFELINDGAYSPEKMFVTASRSKASKARASVAFVRFFSRLLRITDNLSKEQKILAANELTNLFYYDNRFDEFLNEDYDLDLDFEDDEFFNKMSDQEYDRLVDTIKTSPFASETFKNIVTV